MVVVVGGGHVKKCRCEKDDVLKLKTENGFNGMLQCVNELPLFQDHRFLRGNGKWFV